MHRDDTIAIIIKIVDQSTRKQGNSDYVDHCQQHAKLRDANHNVQEQVGATIAHYDSSESGRANDIDDLGERKRLARSRERFGGVGQTTQLQELAREESRKRAVLEHRS